MSSGSSFSAATPDGSAHACAFDGTQGGVDFEGLDDSGSELTIVCWVKLDGFPGRTDPRIISKARSTNLNDHDWMLGFSSRRLRARVRTHGSTLEVRTSGSVDFGVWHHVAMTYDGAHVRLFIDGRLDGTFAKSGPLDTRAFAVGVGNQPHGAGDRALDGSIDRLRVYRRALSPDELARQAQQEATIYAPSTGEELVFALDCEDTGTDDDVVGENR